MEKLLNLMQGNKTLNWELNNWKRILGMILLGATKRAILLRWKLLRKNQKGLQVRVYNKIMGFISKIQLEILKNLAWIL